MNDDDIPVCKLINYQKFIYEQQKRSRQSKSAKVEMKEVRFNPVIADHDMEIKAKMASRILREGDKVRVVIPYKGRMTQYIANGIELMNKFDAMIEQMISNQ